jgi:hypothetical protein
VAGLVLWIGGTVAAGLIADDPGNSRPTVLAFATGGALFFGAVFAVAWWQTRPREDPELDALLGELALSPLPAGGTVAAIGTFRRVARAYIALGALVTALGLLAIVQEGFEFGSAATTLWITVAIVVLWALAVPWVIRRANTASAAILGPLGLTQAGATLEGERHGRGVRVDLTAKGSVTRVEAATAVPELAGDELLARAGRGDERTWEGVLVEGGEGRITVRRLGSRGASWLWDLWLAERLAAE